MKKRIFSNIIAVLAVMIFAASAFGEAFQVDLNTSVPNIPKSKCYQAGSISMKFDIGTVMAAGDVIQFTLNNGVQLCRDIEFFYPVVSPTQGFLVKGMANSLIVTMKLGTLTDGEFETDTDVVFGPLGAPYTMSLFDGKITSVLIDGTLDVPILKDNPATTDETADYTEQIVAADNAICIDTLTFDYMGERVEVTPDSIPVTDATKLTFTGEREIARILSAEEYALVNCKEAPLLGNIELEGGQNATCTFDFNSASGYCSGTYNKIIIQALTNPFAAKEYQITLEVRVNGLTGDQGVYINQASMNYYSTTTLESACDGSGNSLEFATYAGPGTCGGASDVKPDPDEKGCTVDCENKVIRATTVPSDLGMGDNDDFLRLWLPSFRYDSSIVKAGDVVSVRVIVAQVPCGTIFDEEINIGTFGCTTEETSATTLLYPYFTPANGTYFWSAYAITNLSDKEGEVVLYMYEADGDAFKGVLGTPVAAHSIWTTLLSDSIDNPDITWEQTAGTGTAGDSNCYVEAKTTFTADGFGFIAGSPTGESMGYLPRTDSIYRYMDHLVRDVIK